MMETKICSKCEREYPATLEYFNKQKGGKYGLRSACNNCVRKYRIERRLRPDVKERNRLAAAKWRLENPERKRELQRKCWDKNKDRFNGERTLRYKTDNNYANKKREEGKRYYDSGRRLEVNSSPENRRKTRDRNKRYRAIQENRDKIRIYHLKYVESHRERLRELGKRKTFLLRDSYLRDLISQNYKIERENIPDELIKLKRTQLKLHRLIYNV